MGLCYFCGREYEETYQCPYCNLRFCGEHIKPEEHNCIAYKETSEFQVKETTPEPVFEGEPKPVSRPVKKTSPLSNRTQIVVMLVVFSLLSVGVLYLYGGNRGLEALKPMQADYELHSIALGQVNVFRYRNDVPDLSYDADTIAQEHAWELMRTGDLYHNPELPSSMGENVAVYMEHGVDPKVAIALMVESMVNDDEGFGYANRANILDPDFDEVSIGVAIDGDSVWLVLCFS